VAAMKAEAGWGAAAVLVATFVGVGSQSSRPAQPSGSGERSAPASILGTQTAKPEAKSDFERGPCRDLEDTLRRFLLAPAQQIAAPASCYDTQPPKAASPKPTSPKPNLSKSTSPNWVPKGFTNDQEQAVDFQQRACTLQYVIAILPDPLHTHFSLTFDRMAEAIQQGAQDEGYFYDSSWLPWETGEKPLVLLADQDKADDEKKAREEQPGVLLFRGKAEDCDAPITLQIWTPAEQPYCNGLAVFVVGEEPTGGIHKRQFENALDWIAALAPSRSKQVKILGPTFSGSLPSLAQLFAQSGPNNLLSILTANSLGSPLMVYSGGITNNTLAGWFQGQFPKVEFRSFQNDDTTLFKAYRQYLKGLDFEASHLAILSEDETAYGGFSTGDSDPLCQLNPLWDNGGVGPTCLYYPRDLSALRDAYQKEGIFSPGSKADSSEAAQRQLSSNIADPEGKEHDTIRNYSGDQTALSQEASLKQIVSLLQAHEAQYIVVRSSNPLDQLFLSHYLLKTYPAGRIVIEGSDLLLRRETGSTALSGIMTLTNYPLLPWEYHWSANFGTAPYLHDHRIFEQYLAQGTYVASRSLFHVSDPAFYDLDGRCKSSTDTFLPPNCEGLSIPGYAPPFWILPDPSHLRDTSRRPAIWLSVLGRDGFWPVAAFNAPLDIEVPKAEIPASKRHAVRDFFESRWDFFATLFQSWKHRFKKRFEADYEGWPEWPPMPISMKICLLGVFLLAVFHLHCCWKPSITVKPVHRASFVRIPGPSHPTLILFGSAVVAAIPILLAWGYGAMSLGGEPVPHAWWYRLLLPISWLSAYLAVSLNIQDALSRNPDEKAAAAEEDSLKRHLRRVWSGMRLGWAYFRWNKNDWRTKLKFVFRNSQVAAQVGNALKYPKVATFAFGVLTALLYCAVDFFLDQSLNDANTVPTYWRAIHLTTGVSPLVPILALTVGLYLWFWHSLQGLALFGPDRPMLPRRSSLNTSATDSLLTMFSRERAQKPLEDLCDPFAAEVVCVGIGVFVAVAVLAWALAGWDVPIRNLGAKRSAIFFCLFMDLCISLMLANAWQFLRIWLRLRNLLLFLDRMPLRRTTKALKDISWGSVWKMSGGILDVRYKLLSRQWESLNHLINSIDKSKPDGASDWNEQIKKTLAVMMDKFAKWYAGSWDKWQERDLSSLAAFQESIAETAGYSIVNQLLPEWMKEETSLILDLPEKKDNSEKQEKENGKNEDEGNSSEGQLKLYIRNAEELVCLVYLGFVQNILGRLRTLAMQMLWLFVALSASLATYPFDPRPALSGMMLVLFLILGTVVAIVYAQMHRDGTLSLVTNTTPGELGVDFWIKFASFAAGPILGLLATNFPGIPGSLFSWLQPGLESIK
jgi:hypothetical protein